MTHARFCFLSLLLVIFAIGLHGGALKDWSRNTQIRALAVSVTPQQRVEMRAQADRFSHRGSVFRVGGLCLAAAAAGFLIISFRRHEQARWRSVPVALLACYVLFQFVMV